MSEPLFKLYETLPEILLAAGSLVVSVAVYFFKRKKK